MKLKYFFCLPALLIFFSKSSFSKDSLDKYIQKMSDRQKIGQICLMNFRFWEENAAPLPNVNRSGAENLGKSKYKGLTSINPEVEKIIADYSIGSVILFAENISNITTTKALIQAMDNAAAKNGNPPLIFALDQEGGAVSRINEYFHFPAAMAYEQNASLEDTQKAGYYTALQLKEWGFDIDFAPVCDVSNNQANPVIGIRAFSSSPKIVAEYSVAFAEGLKQGGIIPCAKHFPGHGDTATDSHIGLPCVDKPYDEWKEIECIPFKKNIKKKIPMIMTAHIQMPQLDSTEQFCDKSGSNMIVTATLSNKILTGILRKKLRYKGVIVTDAMDMDAISSNFTPPAAFINAVNAGADLICHPINVYSKNDLTSIEDFFETVENALKDGTLSKERLNQAVKKVLELKIKNGICVLKDGKFISTKKSFSMTSSQKDEALLLSKKITEGSFESSSNGIKASPLKAAGKVLFICPDKSKTALIKRMFAAEFPKKSAEFYIYENSSKLEAELSKKIQSCDEIVLFTKLTGYAVNNKKIWNYARPKEIATLIKKEGKEKNTIVISTNLPYDSVNFEEFEWHASYDYTYNGYKNLLSVIFKSEE